MTSTNTLTVILEGRAVGELQRLRNGSLRLGYDAAYGADPKATPLSVSLPPGTQTHGDTDVSPWLWGLLPDNGDVLRRWGRDFGVSAASPYTLLGTQIGHDCAGAVQFCPPGDLDDLLTRPGRITGLSRADIAERLRGLRSDSTSWLGPEFSGQFSLGGAQAKTALHRDGGGWGVPEGSLPTTHILKPAMPGFEDQQLNEHLCLSAASSLGLPAAVTTVERFEDETAIIIERFDRTTINGTLVRIHQEDLCQALSILPSHKYQSDEGPGPGRIAELLRSVVPAPMAEIDVWRFADALIYNWLIMGTDAHGKNYGLLLSGPQVRLAPLYDISSYLPYDNTDGHKVKLAMKIGDDYKLRRTDRRQAWERCARELGLDPDRLVERIVELATRLPTAFADCAESADVAVLGSELPRRLVDLVADRCAHCLSRLV